MWQAEADTELTLSASPTTAVGQKALALAKRGYSTVLALWKNIIGTFRYHIQGNQKDRNTSEEIDISLSWA